MKIAGIDPGVKTGVAIVEDGKLKVVKTTEIHKAFALVGNVDYVVLEDARLWTFFNSKHNPRKQGAGSIKRDCKIWEDFLEDKEIPYTLVKPNNRSTKVSSKLFKEITCYSGRTSEHSRDAAMLVYKLNKYKTETYGVTKPFKKGGYAL
jgi:hypothetical protein